MTEIDKTLFKSSCDLIISGAHHDRWVTNFYVGNNYSKHPLFVLAGSTAKSGFETNFTVSTYHGYEFVGAITEDVTSLRNSSIVSPWVPSDRLASNATHTDARR
ncbi:hypothetical protein BKA67DRAFT_541538 [Truncatella angustata]|uniref:Uncharacterized protein n=1 Tax=Truncatella angustata TaxID=152316 RepID=A0A9P8RFZ6_9PEZI|nr:uncharacterized protein BKA67DRAFT_541538 [Truncatella angustata]KAH6645309.1 hypothetical protein BKA67DRAFT_541538 [Truncatella angustata]